MREHKAVTVTTRESGDRIGANSHSRLPRPDYSRLRCKCCDHSAVIHDPEFVSTIVYQKSYRLMDCDRNSTARSSLVVQSERQMVTFEREMSWTTRSDW